MNDNEPQLSFDEVSIEVFKDAEEAYNKIKTAKFERTTLQSFVGKNIAIIYVKRYPKSKSHYHTDYYVIHFICENKFYSATSSSLKMVTFLTSYIKHYKEFVTFKCSIIRNPDNSLEFGPEIN